METIHIQTKDHTDIVGDYYGGESYRGILLLHMMPADRKSWAAFAGKLAAAGFRALAIDLRGHGESEGGPAGHKNFSNAEHQASHYDVEAAADFLREKGVTELFLAGASIGANLALQYLAAHHDARGAILLSPGLEYRGVKAEPLVAALVAGARTYFAASDEDTYSFESVRALVSRVPAGVITETKLFHTAGHGTAIFESNPTFMDELISWFAPQ